MAKENKSKAPAAGSKVTVRQTRSIAGREKEVIRTLQALGLGRIGKQKELTVNPAVLGMIKRVGYLLEVKESK